LVNKKRSAICNKTEITLCHIIAYSVADTVADRLQIKVSATHTDGTV
jgi:hypothetical protein